MDAEDETAKLKWMLVVGIAFLFSGYMSWREIKYGLFGDHIDATLVRVYEMSEPGRRGTRREVMVVQYEFTDSDGNKRREADKISIDSDRPTGPTIRVQYLDDRSRLSGHTQRFWLIPFFGATAYFVYKFVSLMREAKR